MTLEDEVREVQQTFDRAELDGDTVALRGLIAEDFRSIGPKGYIMDKEAWIARHEHFTYQALDVEELDVRTYDGCAIVRNVQRNRATWQGEELAPVVRVSQVWVRQDGWRLAGIQFSPHTA